MKQQVKPKNMPVTDKNGISTDIGCDSPQKNSLVVQKVTRDERIENPIENDQLFEKDEEKVHFERTNGCCHCIKTKPNRSLEKNEVFPMYTANVLSFLTYHWLTKFAFSVYKRGEILQNDLWQLNVKDNCQTNGEIFHKLWQEEVTRRGVKDASLVTVIWCRIQRNALLGTAVITMSLICGIIGPTVLFRCILNYCASASDDRLWYGLLLVLLYFLTEITHRVLFATTWAFSYKNAVRVRSGLADLLYCKLLKMHTLRDKSVGQIINIFMNDLGRIYEAVILIPFLSQGPITALVAIAYCVVYMGPWSLVGAFVIIGYYPYQVLLSKANVMLRRKAVLITDNRIRLMTQILTHIKLIKLYCWEKPFANIIEGVRSKEFKLLQKAGLVQTMSVSVGPLVPVLAGVLMFVAHVRSGNDLNSTQPFVVLSVLFLVRPKIALTSLIVKSFSDSLVAFKRIKSLLLMKETPPVSSLPKPSDPKIAIQIENGTFTWHPVSDDADCDQRHRTDPCTDKPQSASVNNVVDEANNAPEHSTGEDSTLLHTEATESVEVLRHINLILYKGQLCGVCGSVGSGKSSLISAILGQMEKIQGKVSVSGRLAYVPQQAWILNTTLRENILFGLPYEENRYMTVLERCSLIADIDVLPAGDLTEIGERGINLSGGQKQRVSLARALYSDCDVYLLDDPMSSVDAQVCQHLFEKCIEGALRHKTVLLVTHQLQYLSQCDQVIYLRSGEITAAGTHESLMEGSPEYRSLIAAYQHNTGRQDAETVSTSESTDDKSDSGDDDVNITRKVETHQHQEEYNNKMKDGRLIEKEDVHRGTVTSQTYIVYARSAGGCVLYVFVLMSFLLPVGCSAFTNWWLSFWISHGSGSSHNTTVTVENSTVVNSTIVNSTVVEGQLSDNPKFYFYMTVYWTSALCMVLFLCIRGIVFVKASLRAASNLHNQVFYKILRSPMSFFDTTPIGRIINRFSKDLDDVDVRLPQRSETFLNNVCTILVSLVLICTVFPWFVVAMVPIGIIFLLSFKFYRVVLQEVKRADNVTRSPVSSSLTTTVQGLSLIHAYDKQTEFRQRFREYFDINSVTVFLFCCCNRWMTCRLDLVTTVLTTVTAVFVVCTKGQIASAFAGLALVYAAQITGITQFTVRMASETEALFTSVERIYHYIKNVNTEAPLVIADRRPPAHWPKQGQISFINYSMRYRPALPLVLNNVSFDIRPGEKVGIVGRTGSGKSSLGVALFRLVEPDSGSIKIDDVDIMSVGLEDLRTKLFIIPQDPVLFSGSVRYNLDPFSQHSDNDLWQALSRCYVKAKVQSVSGGLDALVDEGGQNFSVGERQLICLARALLKDAKILILDEATASVDNETDKRIQMTIKEAFAHCTMLTIAHRLHTVLGYDRLLVLHNGQVVEFDVPDLLLQNPNSHLKTVLAAGL